MKLSIVATLYQSASYIAEFYQRATAAARQFAGDDYEIVFVNDGSPDKSLELAVQLTGADQHVTVVDLSRNFGHHRAMMTGLAHARGQNVFLLDSDLEEAPEWLLEFAEVMRIEDCDVVFGVQEERKGGVFERVSGHWFWVLFNFLTGLHLQKNIVTARLMSRRYVDALLLHTERELFIAGLWHITGFRQVEKKVRKRSAGSTTYTLSRKVSLLVNSITSFSSAPLVFIFYFGLAISLVATIYVIYVLLNWLFISRPPSGWTSVMASIWLIGGWLISAIGVVGIYLSKIFLEAKRRPYTIVRRIYGRQ